MALERIVSGGQTGVDRAALDVAIVQGIPHGGWCPRGRRAEDGMIDERYELKETTSDHYPVRTEKNVIDSDGTLILYCGSLTGGTKLTARLAKRHGRPLLLVDLTSHSALSRYRIDVDRLKQWIQNHEIATLNVAGPRESTAPGVSALAKAFLTKAAKGA